jgi:Domain of unknown function (DUF4395)
VARGQVTSAVHPLLPRFAQAITGVMCLEALVFQTWPAAAVALALILLSLAGPRWSPVAWLFRLLARPPARLEPAAPVRFSQGMAALLLSAALALILAGADLAGWILVGLVAGVGLFSAITGFCLGCEAYRLLLRQGRAAHDLREPLGLEGDGPWLVVVTAPGCATCEPVARALAAAAGGREVVRVDLARRPQARAVPVRSVPAALAVAADGQARAARAGRLGDDDLKAVLAAL